MLLRLGEDARINLHKENKRGGGDLFVRFIEQIKAFESLCGGLSMQAQILYYKLFKHNNYYGLGLPFYVTNEDLMHDSLIKNKQTFINARNILIQRGFITYKPGKKGSPSVYQLVDLEPILKGYDLYPKLDQKCTESVPKADQKRTESVPKVGHNIAIAKDKPETEAKAITTREDVFASSGESEKVKALLKDFDEMRKKKRNPMTDKAKELLLKKLDELSGGDEFMKIHLLEQSIEHGWQSIYPLKNDLSTGQKKSRFQENMEAADRAIAFFESQEANRNEQRDGDCETVETVYGGIPF